MKKKSFFTSTLPAIANLALKLPKLCTKPIPLLSKYIDKEIILTHLQISCLIANSFFCTFPRRNFFRGDANEYVDYPIPNFSELFMSSNKVCSPTTASKLRCIINYFDRVTKNVPDGYISFHRQVLSSIPDWLTSDNNICDLHIAIGNIEDAHGLIQVDFANKLIGGGVLGRGCAQEEIRFLICPELIISRLFTAELQDTECLIITGAERYNTYTGYSDTFRFNGNFIDTTPRDEQNRRMTTIVAIDALVIKEDQHQYFPASIVRELNKAFCGFVDLYSPPPLAPIATGHWGCGAFKGSKELKSIIQLMAASQAGRSIYFYPFNDSEFETALLSIYELLKHAKVLDLYKALMEYSSMVLSNKDLKLFDYLYARFE